MEKREDRFLKELFMDFDPPVEISADFNQRLLQKINSQPSPGMQLLHYLRIIGPVLFVFLVAGIVFLIFRGEVLASHIINSVPMLKPWHIFMAFIIIYFHFVRSVLILALLYCKKWFKRAGSLAA